MGLPLAEWALAGLVEVGQGGLGIENLVGGGGVAEFVQRAAGLFFGGVEFDAVVEVGALHVKGHPAGAGEQAAISEAGDFLGQTVDAGTAVLV